MVTEDGLTLGGGHTIQYTDQLSQKCALETYVILLTNVTPINLNWKKKPRDHNGEQGGPEKANNGDQAGHVKEE